MSRLPRVDLTGQVFGQLTVIAHSHDLPRRHFWLCRCEKGHERVCRQDTLQAGRVTCCGQCGKSDEWKSAVRTHNLTGTREYSVWRNMISRCNYPSTRKFPNYGGRGITVCDRWLHSFENFLADLGPRPSKRHSIERKNSDGNYEPSNCHWALPEEQNNNTRRNRVLEWNNQRHTVAEWERILGRPYASIHKRLHKGWTPEEALGIPQGERRTKK